MVSCFTQWVTIKFSGGFVLLTYAYFFLSTSLLSCTIDCSRFILYFPCPSPAVRYFFKLSFSLSGEWYFKTNFRTLGVVIAIVPCCFQTVMDRNQHFTATGFVLVVFLFLLYVPFPKVRTLASVILNIIYLINFFVYY